MFKFKELFNKKQYGIPVTESIPSMPTVRMPMDMNALLCKHCGNTQRAEKYSGKTQCPMCGSIDLTPVSVGIDVASKEAPIVYKPEPTTPQETEAKLRARKAIEDFYDRRL